ncbi:unnamed protein product [Phytophthora lilii]|uniref:Unnamed protein product n=1 Tax=Phytophthora lilii TaxID=2077276 RepID=A0A9W6TLL7_9STRA|nr:unnamed protein product [Phytophthora lilii]
MVLYIFFTVPFRLAFYYNPVPNYNFKETHRWTRELSVFVALDAIVDVIGLVEFVGFYHVWKATFYELTTLTSLRSVKDRASDTDRLSTANIMARRLSSTNFQLGRVNWTISSIKPFSSMPGDEANHTSSQQKYKLGKNVELVLELIALMPIEVIPLTLGTFNNLHLARVTKLCRLYRFRRCLLRLAKLYSDRDFIHHVSSSGVDSLVRTIGMCAGLCHWVACGYMLIAHSQCGVAFENCKESVENSWVIRDRLHGASVGRKYGRTLYWASRTLVLLGYDDVTPVSNAETLYAVVVTIMGALFGTSLLANFLFLFRFRNARYAAYSAHVDNARNLDSEEALQLLPQHLQSKVIATLRANRIAQVCFFIKESVEFINELAIALKRRVYSPGDLIIEPKVNAQMFFVIRGQVMISNLSGGKPTECKTGDFFAEMCLLFPEVYLQRAIAKSFCELYVLTKAKFDEALSEYHKGTEHETRRRMAETVERYQMQLRKTKKILGLQDGYENLSGRTSLGRFSAGRFSVGRSKSSQGRSSVGKSTTSVGRSSLGRSTRTISPGASNAGEWRQKTNWRLPGSPFRVFWDTIRLVAIVYVAFEVPYFAVFISMTEGQHMFVIDPNIDLRYAMTTLVEVFFAFDLILRTRVFAFMDHSIRLAIARPDLIFAAYKANGFFLDLLAWIPVGDVLDSLHTESLQVYSSLFRLLRLLRLRLLPELLQELTDSYGISSNLHIVVSLVLGVTLTLHIVGCIWFEMALFPPDSPSDHGDSAIFIAELTRSECLRYATLFQNCSWVKFDCYAHLGLEFPRENPSTTYQAPFAYLRSVYWAMVTLTAVGYGDIVAYSTAETYFAALWVFLGGIINFGVMGAMSSIISNLTATHHHHMEKLNIVNSIMERVNISRRLSTEVRRFYHQQFVGHKQAYESQLLSHLPDQLCYQISSLLHADAVKSVMIFDSASIEFLREVTGKFRHRSYQNGETICLEGDVCRKFFVLLPGSKANIFFRSRKVPIRALHCGDCYGVNDFLLKKSHAATIVAASLVHASVMSREQFDEIQRKFADDLRDMRDEAQAHWTEERTIMKRIVANLSRVKLQPHLLQTPSLFYQRDNAFITSGDDDADQGLYTVSDTFMTLWNALITLWNMYNAIFVIFRVCFHSHLHLSGSASAAVWITDLICDICYAVDIYLRLYYFGSSERGITNLIERKKIDKQYLRSSSFRWNLIASLPMYTPFGSGTLVASVCRIPRLVRCVDLWSYLDNVIVQIQQHFASLNVSAYLSPIKLLIVLVLVAHYVGCIFFLISERECEHVARCWMAHDPVLHDNHSVPMLYAKTFYWAITTLLLVGSREIVPRGMAGTLWTGFTCLCCTFVIGHIVGEISELILELGKETRQYKTRIASFESFANEHDISAALRERVTYFFRVEFEETKGINMCQTMHDLSANLRLKFMLEIYGHSIEKLPISSFLTATQINNLALRLQPELFIPGDNILVEGMFGSRLCTLRKGIAATYWTKSVASVAVLMEGAFFGEIAFFLPNQRRLATVRATTSCEVLHITKHDWQELWLPSDDPSDTNVQKHAQRSGRGLSRFFTKNKDLDAPPERISSRDGHVLLWAPTPPHKLSKVEICRMFVSPTIQLLEKKAEYLLSKSTACSQLLSDGESTTRRDSQQKHPYQMERAKTRRQFWNSIRGRVSDQPADTRAKKTDELRHLQFIVDLNPINENVSHSLGADNIRELETESWARFKLLAALQHVVSTLLSDLVPSEPGVEQTPQISLLVKPKKPRQLRPFRFDERAKQKWSAAIMQMVSSVSRRKTIGAEAALAAAEIATPRPSTKLAPVRRRSFPAVLPQVQDLQSLATALKSPAKGKHRLLVRSRSLKVFGDDFFRDREHYKGYYRIANDERKGGPGVDFEILQRCQRPQYATQLKWYNRYRRWKRSWPGLTMAALKNVIAPGTTKEDHDQNKNQVFPLSDDIKRAGYRPGNTRSEVVDTARLHIPNQQVLRAAISDFQSKLFIKRIKQLGKAWDFIMLLASAYHSVVTPFKVCFSHEVTELSAGVLITWSGVEIFLDALCWIDLCYNIYNASPKHEGLSIASRIKPNGSIHRVLTLTSELRVNIVAMLPLEILLVTDVHFPTTILHLSAGATEASWWTTRWVLRMNRMLLARRVQPLSEELFQFAIHDLQLCVSEAMLHFLRSVASYIAMGHILACIWFITSEVGLWHYGGSWLSTPGMLVFKTAESMTADVSESHRALSAVASSFTLESVSFARKYLRSLLFSLECISTLFYGDIISMNPLELVVEIAITFWSIYIYGALVDVVLATQRDFAAQVRVFRVLDENFLRGLLVCLEYVVCSEGEEIVTKGDMDRSMYFIAQGRVLVRLDSGEMVRERGEFFGEFALLYGISRLETCTAVSVAELYRLDHDPYERLLQDFPGYRRRNKQAWTTPAPQSHSALRASSFAAKGKQAATTILGMAPILARRASVRDLDAAAQTLESEVAHTYVYRSSMDMMAQLHSMHPEEAKQLILKVRAGSRKRLSRELAQQEAQD